MTVILGTIEKDAVVLAGDKRGTSYDGKIIRDDLSKVKVINRRLAFASGGNAAIGMAIEMDANKALDKENMKTDGLLEIIRRFYSKAVEIKSASILAMPFSFLIAGVNQKNDLSLFAGEQRNGIVKAQEVQAMLYPPEDVKSEICSDIMAKHYNFSYPMFVERTIKEIALKSKYVSPSGEGKSLILCKLPT